MMLVKEILLKNPFFRVFCRMFTRWRDKARCDLLSQTVGSFAYFTNQLANPYLDFMLCGVYFGRNKIPDEPCSPLFQNKES